MKTLKFFVGLIALLFVLCLVTGCKMPRSIGLPGYSSHNGFFWGPFEQYPDGKPEKVEPYNPDDWIGPTVPAPTNTPPPTPAIQSKPVGLRGDSPLPVGPPTPGRLMAIPLTWQHSPSLDGTTQYRVYHSRQTNGWDGFETVQAGDFQTSGKRYLWQYRQGGTFRFAATALRPPDAESGETNLVESDPSNTITVRAKGFPDAPTELAPKR